MSYVYRDTYLARRRRAGTGVIPDHPCAKGHMAWWRDTSTGYVRCKECLKEQSLRWRTENKERALMLRRSSRLKRTFGLSYEDKEAMWVAQGGKCLICGLEQRIANMRIDHNHSTGAIRGLLCNACNLLLGRMEVNMARTEACLQYLTS